jgi:hypothetical protein
MSDVLLSGNAIGAAGARVILSGIDPGGSMTRILLHGCGLNDRDGPFVRLVAPEGGRCFLLLLFCSVWVRGWRRRSRLLLRGRKTY